MWSCINGCGHALMGVVMLLMLLFIQVKSPRYFCYVFEKANHSVKLGLARLFEQIGLCLNHHVNENL